MSTWLTLNSAGLLLEGVVLYLVLRQLGFVLRRVGPVGARSSSEGPRVGENIAYHLAEILGRNFEGKAKLIVFVSDECSICRVIREGAMNLTKSWRADASIVLIYDCFDKTREVALRKLSGGLYEVRAYLKRQELGATFVPFAVVTDDAWTVVAKGLVNEIGHLESLLELERAKRQETARAPRASLEILMG